MDRRFVSPFARYAIAVAAAVAIVFALEVLPRLALIWMAIRGR